MVYACFQREWQRDCQWVLYLTTFPERWQTGVTTAQDLNAVHAILEEFTIDDASLEEPRKETAWLGTADQIVAAHRQSVLIELDVAPLQLIFLHRLRWVKRPFHELVLIQFSQLYHFRGYRNPSHLPSKLWTASTRNTSDNWSPRMQFALL